MSAAASPFFLEAAVDAVLAFVANLEYWARFGQESGGEELEKHCRIQGLAFR